MPLVKAWSASIPRRYFAAGIGKSTEDAVGRLLLTAEGATENEEAACTIWDIDKCYEHVGHEKLMRAASLHGFPMAILRMCLKMYERRKRWHGKEFSAHGSTPTAH